MAPDEGTEPDLRRLLGEARRRGLIGSAPISELLAHAESFATLVPRGSRSADLGSGAGLPGLVVALRDTAARLVLIEASQSRVDHLVRSVTVLGLGDRVEVDGRRAEDVGRDSRRRGSFDVVLARSFGAPAVVAECAAPLLRVGGLLVVSEPPGSTGERWTGLVGSGLPLILGGVRKVGQARFARLRLEETCPERFPRRSGVPARRRLFDS